MNTNHENLRPAQFYGACVLSLGQHYETVMKLHSDYLPREAVSLFLQANVNKHLLSVGSALGGIGKKEMLRMSEAQIERFYGRKMRDQDRYIRLFADCISKVRQQLPLDGCEVAVDSGGYDLVQEGGFPLSLFPDLIDFYYRFLEEHPTLYDRAFPLDLAPGYKRNPFPSLEEMDELNYVSYTRAESLPPEVRDKMVYIHHFRSTGIRDTWLKFLFEDGLADKFVSFATGGLATSPEMTQVGCLAYALPLVDIIKYVKTRRSLTGFLFHILGDADWKDFLPHMLLEEHIRATHGLDVTITCDSSSIFQAIGKGRYTFVYDEGQVLRISLRSDEINGNHLGLGTHAQLLVKHVNSFAGRYGLRPFDIRRDPILEFDGQLTTLAFVYAVFGQLALFKQVEDYCRVIAARTYPIYQSGNIPEFERQVAGGLRKLHDGMTYEGIPAYATRITKSLQLIERLDLDEVASLVARLPEHKEFRP